MFETIYNWFTSFYGGDMADYLSGYICPSVESDGGFMGANQYIMYGMIALAFASAVAVIFYYVIDHPRYNKVWHWLLLVLLVGASNFGVAVAMLRDEWFTVGTAECLINGENGGLNGNTCIGFGMAHAFVSILFFITISLSIKWRSRNCKRCPF